MQDRLPQVHARHSRRRDEEVSSGSAPSRHPSRRLALPALAAASAVLLLGGCSGEGDTASAASAKPPTVEKLGKALGCKTKITRGKVEDYRQGVCVIDKERYTVVTFKNNKVKREWLEFSKEYGGTYLVGSQWIVVGEPPTKLATVQGKYGGSIEEGDKHAGH